MNSKKKKAITIALSILICLIGLVGSISGSLRYGMRDRAIETLAEEWELSQMQITKIADRMSMALFFVVMVGTPGIEAEGAENLLDAEYTREFIADKIKDFRDDLLHDTGKGRIDFSEIIQLEEDNRDAVTRDLHYQVTSEDMERYETIWDNLALDEKFILDTYRIDHPALFAAARIILSNVFLLLTALLVVAAGAWLWFLNERSFRGHRIYGAVLLILGAADCAMSASSGWMADKVNQMIDMRSNVMDLFFAPVGQMFLILGGIFLLLGAVSVALSVMTDRKKKSTGP